MAMKIGFFGCGNMGAALALGIKKINPSVELYFYTPTQTRARDLALKTKGHFVEELGDMPEKLDWYILSFKPQSLAGFHFNFLPQAKLLSVLAGVSIETLAKKFSVSKICRLMPNTPSSLGMGANLFFGAPEVSENDNLSIRHLLEGLGSLFVMKSEEEIDQLTPFSGSGPALVFELARIFESELQKLSGGNIDAREIIAQTFLGSAYLMKHSSLSFDELRAQVTSQKGVTYEALKVLKENNLEDLFSEAFKSCYNRVTEIKEEIHRNNK
jgi:pyrroline-5-carboxylate reductase